MGGVVQRGIALGIPRVDIGLHVHEKPLLSAHENTPLRPGMVFAVETRVRWPEKEGYHIEDFVVITEEGPELVTNVMDTSRLMEI